MFGALALVVGIGFYLPMTLLAPLRAVEPVISKNVVVPGEAAQLSFPSYGGSAVGAVGFDGVLAQSGSTAPLPMASITKIVTMLVVLEAKPLKSGIDGPSITMTSTDVGLYSRYLSMGGQVTAVRAGWTFTQLEMMQLALVHSANNYAASLANWAYGSTDAYLAAAKSWVAVHKLSSMTITDPTGIDPRNAASSADLVMLGKLALANPVLASIVGTKTVTIPNVGSVTNTNTLLGTSGIDGIKTGTLSEGSNLLFASDRRVGDTTVTIVGVVLGAPTHAQLDADVTILLTGVRAGFHRLQLTTRGEVFARYTTAWGQTATATARTSVSVVTWSSTAVTGSSSVATLTTGTKGQSFGTATFTVAGRTIRVPLGLSATVNDPGPGWRLSHPGLIVGAP